MYEINHDTFKQLWDEHFRPLVYLCRKYKVHKDAEDIVMDKFTKLWEMRNRFTAPIKVKAFLYVSVMNAIRNQWKLIGRIVEFDYSEDVESGAPLEEIEASVIKSMYDEIEKLPPVCKTVFKMRMFDGKTHDQICKELNRAYNTVDNQFTRAKQLLRKRIRYEF